jgi:hypothetical protein
METVTCTYLYSYIEQHRNGWGHKRIAKWGDVEDFDYPVECIHGAILDQVRPRKGERFIITVTEFRGNRFSFPIEFEGVNNNKHFIFDFRWKKLFPTDKIPIEGPVRIDKKINIGEDIYQFTGSLYDTRVTDSNKKYFAFKPQDIDCDFILLNYKNKGFDLISWDWNDIFRVTLERPLYEIKDIGIGQGIKIVYVAEFPILIENLTKSKVVEYDLESQTYQQKINH